MELSDLDNRYFPAVDQAIPTADFRVYLYFDDGSIRLFDASPILDLPVFRALRDKEVFVNSCAVLNGTLAWDLSGTFDETTCLDLDPLELYRTSPEVEEPEWVRGGGQPRAAGDRVDPEENGKGEVDPVS